MSTEADHIPAEQQHTASVGGAGSAHGAATVDRPVEPVPVELGRSPQGRRRALLRRARRTAIALWCAIFGYRLITAGPPYDLPSVILWSVSAAVVFSLGRRAISTVVLDFAPLAAVLVAFLYLRGAATSVGLPTWWTPQLTFDRTLFLGVEPTAWLQAHLHDVRPRWWDAPISICYVSFFVVPWVTATVLWLRNRRSYYRWTIRVVTLFFLGFAAFVIIPAAPPWAAARCTVTQVADHPSRPACMYQVPARTHGGLIGAHRAIRGGVSPYVQRISTIGLPEVHLTSAQKLVDLGAATTNPVAAVPSLHAGVTLLFAIFLWRRVRREWRPVLACYPVFMAFTLVYTGEHYVFDVLIGWLLAVIVSVAANRLESRSSADLPAGQ